MMRAYNQHCLLLRYDDQTHVVVAASCVYPNVLVLGMKIRALLNNGMNSKRCHRQIGHCTGIALHCPAENHPSNEQFPVADMTPSHMG